MTVREAKKEIYKHFRPLNINRNQHQMQPKTEEEEEK